uniref:Envelope protein n=1 Tax=Panagrolaimus superbus TaxID=310955 RepID=A0A914YMR4_9BILA
MEELTAAINNINEMISNDRYLTKTKQEFEFHVNKMERGLLKFMKLLGSRKSIKLSELPEPLLNFFEKVGYTENKLSEKLYLLRLKSCHRKSVVVEVIAAETNGVDAIKSFSPCTCEINSINQCKIKTQHALNNFIQFETYDELTTVATTYKVYTIQYPTKSVTKNVPVSGVFTVVINEDDFVKIGEYTISGKSLKPTYIENIIDDTFVVGEMAETKNITLNFTNLNSELNAFVSTWNFKLLIGIFGLLCLFTAFLFVGCCIYKKCTTKKSYNKLAFVVPQLSS